MALNKMVLKTQILNAMNVASNNNSNTPEQRREAFAQALADALDEFVKGADGIYQSASLVAGQVPVTRVGPAVTIKLQ